MAATLLSDGRSAPVHFPSVDALALHLLRQRPGRTLDLLAQTATRDGGPDFPVVAVFAPRASLRRERDGRLIAVMGDEWLGWAADDAADVDALGAAIRRMTPMWRLAA